MDILFTNTIENNEKYDSAINEKYYSAINEKYDSAINEKYTCCHVIYYTIMFYKSKYTFAPPR